MMQAHLLRALSPKYLLEHRKPADPQEHIHQLLPVLIPHLLAHPLHKLHIVLLFKLQGILKQLLKPLPSQDISQALLDFLVPD